MSYRSWLEDVTNYRDLGRHCILLPHPQKVAEDEFMNFWDCETERWIERLKEPVPVDPSIERYFVTGEPIRGYSDFPVCEKKRGYRYTRLLENVSLRRMQPRMDLRYRQSFRASISFLKMSCWFAPFDISKTEPYVIQG